MWEPRRLTTLWAFTVCYRDVFAVYLYCKVVIYIKYCKLSVALQTTHEYPLTKEENLEAWTVIIRSITFVKIVIELYLTVI
jgi:hypothetical protein